MITGKDVKHRSEVVFQHPDFVVEGYFAGSSGNFFFCSRVGSNRRAFNELGIDAENFIAGVVGYRDSCDWPVQRSRADFAKVLNALLEFEPRLTIKIDGKEFKNGMLFVSLDDFFKVK